MEEFYRVDNHLDMHCPACGRYQRMHDYFYHPGIACGRCGHYFEPAWLPAGLREAGCSIVLPVSVSA